MKSEFFDIADYSYTWTGEQVVTPAPHPGEIGEPCDCTYWRTSKFGIMHLDWNIADGHLLKFSSAPTWHSQSSENDYLAASALDPEDVKRDMFSLVLGASYTVDFFDNKFQNEFFVKRYSQEREAEQLHVETRELIELDSSINRFGWGNALRYKFYPWLVGKASYEQAARLPSFREVFGNAESIIPNTELEEEYSNNFNLSLELDGLTNTYGSWKGGANVFLRDIENAIFLTTQNDVSQYQNIFAVESSGYQFSGGWSSPEDFINFSANYTYVDLINTSSEGLFAQYKDERVPNRPYSFFNTKAALKWIGVLSNYDELEVEWNYRQVEKFELLWGDEGLSQFNPNVPTQESHSLAASYTKDFISYLVTLSAEVQNMTDEQLYDYYGVQRPGRAYYMKMILEF